MILPLPGNANETLNIINTYRHYVPFFVIYNNYGFNSSEPAVASSDATNMECSIRRDGQDYVINGRKWWTSGKASRVSTRPTSKNSWTGDVTN